MMARSPSLKTQSSALTHFRIAPYRRLRAPAALVDTIPPRVQKLPLDGSTGSRSPRSLARHRARPQHSRLRPHGARSLVKPSQTIEPREIDNHSRTDRTAGHAAARPARHERGFRRGCPFHESRYIVVIRGHCYRGRHCPTNPGCLGVDGARELVFAIDPPKAGRHHSPRLLQKPVGVTIRDCSLAEDSRRSHRIPSRISCRACPRAPSALATAAAHICDRGTQRT